MDIQFRTATAEDEEKAIPLIYSSGPMTFNYVFSVDYEQQSLDFLRHAYRQPKGQFSHSEHTLITDNDQVVGCASVGLGPNALENLLIFLRLIFAFYGLWKGIGVIYRGLKVERVVPPAPQHVAYISNVGAAPKGRGYGSRLIDHCIEHARDNGFDTAALDVADTNTNARRLYERMQFSQVRHTSADSDYRWGKLVGHSYMEKDISAAS